MILKRMFEQNRRKKLMLQLYMWLVKYLYIMRFLGQDILRTVSHNEQFLCFRT